MPSPTGQPATHDRFTRAFVPLSNKERDRRAVLGGAFMLASRMGMVVVGMGSVMVLARVLEPADFGLLAMALLFFKFVGKFRTFGLSDAATQAPDLDHDTATMLFMTNLKLTVCLALACAAVAPLIAWVFGEPRLIAITLILSASGAVLGLGNVHQGLLRRQLRFGVLTTIDLVAVLLATGVAIGAALAGLGYWALVLQELLRDVVMGLLSLATARWQPRFRLNPTEARLSVRAMLGYGGNLSAANTLAYLGRNLDFMLIGVMSGANALGLYDKAYKWASLAFREFYLPSMKVAMAKLARIHSDAEPYRTSIRRIMLAMFTVITPSMAFLFVEAEAFLLLLLGDQWTEAVPLFQILLVGTFFNGLSQVTKWIYKSEGRTREHLRWTFVSTPLLAGGVAIGAVWGPTGIAIGFSAVSLVMAFPALTYCLRGSLLRLGDLLGPIAMPTLGALLAAAATYAAARWFAIDHRLLRIAASGCVMVPAYLLAFCVLPGARARLGELSVAFGPLLDRLPGRKKKKKRKATI